MEVSRHWIKSKALIKNEKETVQTLMQLNNGDTSICKRELDCFMVQYQLLKNMEGHFLLLLVKTK